MTGHSQVPSIRLNNGTSIPQLGLGTWPMDDVQVATVIAQAVELGYRHFDTAAKYGNEVGVGRGVRASGLDRGELFVTTKLDGGYQGEDRAVAGLDACLKRLDLDYVDLLLIHWPLPDRDLYVDTWHTFERLLATGKTRAIGVSNFKPDHLARLLSESDVVPAVDQVQLNPAVPRPDHLRFNREHGIVTSAWSPLGAGNDMLASPILARVGERHGKTPAQVVLRWHIQQGVVALPRSTSRERLAQNIDIFDFELTESDLYALDKLWTGGAVGVDSDSIGH